MSPNEGFLVKSIPEPLRNLQAAMFEPPSDTHTTERRFGWMGRTKPEPKPLPSWLITVNTQHGGIDAVIASIQTYLEAGKPVYHPPVGNYPQKLDFFLVGEWLIDTFDGVPCQLLHLQDIVAIVGNTQFRTQLILKDGTTHSLLFSKLQWRHIFELFQSLNPSILAPETLLTLPNGTKVEIYEAVIHAFECSDNGDMTLRHPETLQTILDLHTQRTTLTTP